MYLSFYFLINIFEVVLKERLFRDLLFLNSSNSNIASNLELKIRASNRDGDYFTDKILSKTKVLNKKRGKSNFLFYSRIYHGVPGHSRQCARVRRGVLGARAQSAGPHAARSERARPLTHMPLNLAMLLPSKIRI